MRVYSLPCVILAGWKLGPVLQNRMLFQSSRERALRLAKSQGSPTEGKLLVAQFVGKKKASAF